MKYKDGDERQKRRGECPKLSGKSAAVAAGIWMLVFASGCSGQRDGVGEADALEGARRAEEATEKTTEEEMAEAEFATVETKDVPEKTIVEGKAETAEEEIQKEGWKEDYLNSLRTGEINGNGETLPIREIDFFVPAYIDDDEIPELFFYYHADPALLIYDPQDGFTWSYFGRNEIFWQERTGNIVMYFDYISGYAYLTEYHLSEGKLEEILKAVAEDSGDGLSHDWNGEVVSKEEFAARRDDLLGQMTHNLFDEGIVSYSFEELCGILEG